MGNSRTPTPGGGGRCKPGFSRLVFSLQKCQQVPQFGNTMSPPGKPQRRGSLPAKAGASREWREWRAGQPSQTQHAYSLL